jgi:hypothetical protein
VRTTQTTPGGIRVCGHALLTAEELDAVDQLADAVREQQQRRRAGMTDAERAAEDWRRLEGQARLRRLQQSAREGRRP